MTWITTGPHPLAAHPEILVMLRRAVAADPADPRRQRALARELSASGEQAAALAAFAALLALEDPGADLGEDWPAMALAMLEVESAQAVLDLCAGHWHGEGTAAWHYVRARALRRCGRTAEAQAEFVRAIALGDPGHEALRALLRMYADAGDGAGLLAACDTLPAVARDTAATRAYRALALSLLSRDDEACALVDLDAGTMRFAFVPPARFGDLAAFNDALATAILADQPPDADGHDILINHAIALPDSAELAVLQAFIADCYAAYVARFAEAPAPFVPPIGADATLDYGAVTIRRQGRNGQHIHPAALLTGVYHARVPPVTEDGAGALVVGLCDEIAPGHHACWGTRVLPAIPGTLTIFPAHYFHDVRPTGVDAPRVVVVSDLMRGAIETG